MDRRGYDFERKDCVAVEKLTEYVRIVRIVTGRNCFGRVSSVWLKVGIRSSMKKGVLI